ncbi:unnamed protein product, partial [Mesorhabditis belari]|uniref:glutamine synthetase n=1 Tax=Mesorhabditis belari TaxID=2138241 RepID=A0AAF3EQE7_9BILA
MLSTKQISETLLSICKGAGIAQQSAKFHTKLPLATPVVNIGLNQKPHPTKCLATYVWIDGTGEHLRSKTRTLKEIPKSIEHYPMWQYDGSSCGQAQGRDSDLFLRPVADYPDPFLGGNSRLVLCDTLSSQLQPTATNKRADCLSVMKAIENTEPWFGMEQEYLLLDRDGHPLGWPKNGYPAPQGPYYCGVGADRVFGREVIDTHYVACLNAGIEIGGTNAEVTPGQWEYQVGTCEGIAMADQLWMSRYLLHRVAEQFGVLVTFDPKPAITMGDWNGAGCHTNFSTLQMRNPEGLDAIKEACERLGRTHHEDIKLYDPNQGRDNLRRLTGKHETSSVEKFSWGIADRGCSVRITRFVAIEGRGYLEDRRPSSNCDPYSVTGAIAKSILLTPAGVDEPIKKRATK